MSLKNVHVANKGAVPFLPVATISRFVAAYSSSSLFLFVHTKVAHRDIFFVFFFFPEGTRDGTKVGDLLRRQRPYYSFVV